MVVSQGDLFWVDLGEPAGSRPGFRRPFVVVQNDLFNRSRLSTVIVCALTSNLRRAEAPGNVLLPKGAGNLPRESVAAVLGSRGVSVHEGSDGLMARRAREIEQ